MDSNLISKSSVTINAPASKVWEALVTPELIKQYLFGTEAKSDWKVGSEITYSGVWEGKPYQDKGVINNIIPEKLLETTYWSVAFGEDIPENYLKVSYELEANGDQTTLTISQENKTEASKEHSSNNWNTVLKSLKEMLEK